MEAPEIVPQVKVFSRSALHSFITSSEKKPEAPKSTFNPYRKRPGILGFLGLEAVNEAIAEVSREEQKKLQETEENEYVSLPPARLAEVGG